MSNGDLFGFASDLFGFGAEEAFPGASIQPMVEASPGVDFGAPATSGLSDFAGKLGAGAGKVGAGLAREFTESPLKAFSQTLGLGATGLGISSALGTQRQLAEQTRLQKQGQQAAQAAAAPAVAAGTEQLAESRAGKLQAPMEAAIAQWVQQAKADMRARFASMGLGNSTDIQFEESRIDQMALAMKAQLLQGQEGLALEALQTGVSAGTGTAQVASQQQTTLAALIQQANSALGQMTGRSA